jgi:aminobenzoyl-glutamate utilization protein B
MEYEVIHGLYNLIPNDPLQRVVWEKLNEVGGVEYDEAERDFAELLRASLPEDSPPLGSASEVQPYDFQRRGMGSTDVADVSWVVPTAGLRAATWVPGTSSHSWQAVAAGGTSIGAKGMMVAAKALSLTAVELFTRPEVIAEAWVAHRERIGPDFVYRPILGDRAPPLDYRRE